MRTALRGANPSVRLNCEALEDRTTPALAFALNGPNLISFDTATPGTRIVDAAITGLTGNEAFVGLDFRPSNGLLYGLGVDAGNNTATLYTINTTTAAATAAGAAFSLADGAGATLDLPVAATGYGFDFNPTVDLIRVTTGNGSALNFRITPGTGQPVDNDTNVAGNQVDSTAFTTNVQSGVDAVAYTNVRSSTGGLTSLYGLNTDGDQLVRFISANAGTLNAGMPITVGGMGLDFTSVNGFDIPESVRVTTANDAAPAGSVGFAVLTVGANAPTLYSIDLNTGAATAITGDVAPAGQSVSGFTLAPAGTVAFQNATATVAEGTATATIPLTRTGGTTGTITVTVTVTGTTGTPGSDFQPGPYTVTFNDGDTTANLVIPITNDAVVEANELVSLAITSAINGAGAATPVGTQATNALTISDNDFSVAFQTVSFGVSEGTGVVNLVLIRTGAATAASTVTLTYSGNATPGADFTPAGPFSVTFNAGSLMAMLPLAIVDDTLAESAESIVLTVTNVTAGGTIGIGASASVTISDNDVAPPAPSTAPAISGAVVVGNVLVLTGAGVPGGTQVVALPPGSFALFADLNGDGRGEAIVFLPSAVAVIDGQTGRLAALSADVTGDGVRDLQLFNADGTTTTTDGRTGRVF